MSGTLPTRKTSRFPDGLGEWFYELRHGLTHRTGYEKNWRTRWAYTLRSARCGAGLHWPIKWSQGYYSGGYEPPEPTWECATCGYERLPYRAWFWDGPGGRLLYAWTWIRHPREMWQARQDDRASMRRGAADDRKANPS